VIGSPLGIASVIRFAPSCFASAPWLIRQSEQFVRGGNTPFFILSGVWDLYT
jgi:hypothetical protein